MSLRPRSILGRNIQAKGYLVDAITMDFTEGQPVFRYSNDVNYKNLCTNKFKPLWIFLFKMARLFATLSSTKKDIRKRRRQLFELLLKAKLFGGGDLPQESVVISYQAETTFLLKKILKIKNPVITMLHLDPENFFQVWDHELLKMGLESSNAVQVLMPEYEKVLNKYARPSKVIVIPNIVPQYYNICNYNNKKIINIARFSRDSKRQHLAVDAFFSLSKKHPEWTMELWGDYKVDVNYFNYLTDMIKKSDYGKNVKICGTTNDVESVLNSASIFLFPSAREGFPLALTEAMSKGLAVIGCKECPSVDGLIRNDVNGLLTKASPQDIAVALDQLMGSVSYRERLGKMAHNDMQRYAPDIVWGQWEFLIKTISENK